MVREGWPHGHPQHYRGGPRPPHPGMDAVSFSQHVFDKVQLCKLIRILD